MSNMLVKRGTPVKANQHVITAWGRWHTARGGGVMLRGCGGMLRGGQSQTPAGAKLVVPGLAHVEGNDAIEEAEGLVRGRGVVERGNGVLCVQAPVQGILAKAVAGFRFVGVHARKEGFNCCCWRPSAGWHGPQRSCCPNHCRVTLGVSSGGAAVQSGQSGPEGL